MSPGQGWDGRPPDPPLPRAGLTGVPAPANVPAVRSRRAATFAELAALFADGLRSENTRRAYLADLRRFERWCTDHGVAALSVTRVELERFRSDSERQGASAATVSRRLSTLSSFFAWAVDGDRRDDSPMDGVDRPEPEPPRGQPPVLDAAQAGALVAAGGRLNPKVALLVNLLLLDGVKLGEALSADASELNHDATALQVPRRRGPATIQLQAPTTAAAQAYLAGRRGGPLLRSDSPTGDAGRLTRFGADYLLKQAGTEAALADSVTANLLRRSYVSLAHRSGDTLAEIRDHLGHEDVRTTRRHLGGS